MPPMLFHLAAKKDLTHEQATELFHFLVNPETMDGERVAVLAALRDKGETAVEVSAFAKAMRASALDPGITPVHEHAPIMDVVGTGGDGANTLNISTAAALLVAATTQKRVSVVKHGNRAVSSKSGASDVLAALGLPAAMDPPVARALLKETGFTYLHAPHYHPSVAAVAAARKQLGTRSIFNLLGPLTNPAKPTNALIGAYSPEAGKLIAYAAKTLGFRSLVVVHTVTGPGKGLDEATTCLPFTEWRSDPYKVNTLTRTGAYYGFHPPGKLEDLRGRDAGYNAQVIRDIFEGGQHPAKETIILNAGIALARCGWCGDGNGPMRMALASIHDGRAAELLRKIEAFGKEHPDGK